jgi:hypothetical protein
LTTSLVEVLLRQRGGLDRFSRCDCVSVAHPHLHPHSSYPLVCRGLLGGPVESLDLSRYFFQEKRIGPAVAPPVSRHLFLAFGGAPGPLSPCHTGGREWREHRAPACRRATHPPPFLGSGPRHCSPRRAPPPPPPARSSLVHPAILIPRSRHRRGFPSPGSLATCGHEWCEHRAPVPN